MINPDTLDLILRHLTQIKTSQPGAVDIDDEQMAAYLEGRLTGAEREEVERMILASGEAFRQFVEESRIRLEVEKRPVAMPPDLRERILQTCARQTAPSVSRLIYRAARNALELINNMGAIQTLTPAFGTVRNKDLNPETSIYNLKIESYAVELATNKQADGLFEIWLRLKPGQLAGQNCDWQLWSGNSLLESQPSQTSEALFSDVPVGRYYCVLLISGERAGAIDLSLEEGGNG